VFSCNLPSALLAEWPGSFTCYCGNTGVERIPKKESAQKADPGEEGLEPGTFRSRVRRSNHWALPALPSYPLLESVSWHTCSIASSAWPIQDLTHPKRLIQACVLLCLSRLRRVSCGDFRRHWSMLWPAPLSVWLASAGASLAWTSWCHWVCPWRFTVWLALPRSALCSALADLSVPFLRGLVHSP